MSWNGFSSWNYSLVFSHFSSLDCSDVLAPDGLGERLPGQVECGAHGAAGAQEGGARRRRQHLEHRVHPEPAGVRDVEDPGEVSRAECGRDGHAGSAARGVHVRGRAQGQDLQDEHRGVQDVVLERGDVHVEPEDEGRGENNEVRTEIMRPKNSSSSNCNYCLIALKVRNVVVST